MKKILILLFSASLLNIATYSQIYMNVSGNVGIGQTDAGSYKLYVNGTSYFGNSLFRGNNVTIWPSADQSTSKIIIDGSATYGYNWATIMYPSSNNKVDLGKSNSAFRAIYCYSFQDLNSDSTQKENIRNIQNSLDIIKKMRGIKYDMRKEIAFGSDFANKNFNTSKSDIERKNKIGFIAQEMIKVLPEAVKIDDSTGIYSIDYTRVIPVLVEAMKEQQKTIDKLANDIEKLKSKSSLKSAQAVNEIDGTILNSSLSDYETAILYQNSPNPFSITTEIKYYLPTGTKQSTLYVYNMQGNQVKALPITIFGKSSITINGNELKAGMYFYTLIADGNEVDTKKMILTE